MKTDSLIDRLARDAGPAPRRPALRRLLVTATLGTIASLLLAFLIEASGGHYGVPHIAWWKLAYAAGFAGAAGWLAARLGRPLAHIDLPRFFVVLAIGCMSLAGIAAVVIAPADERMRTILGDTWMVCPWMIALVSLPALLLGMWALRGLAPTRPKQAGLATGLYAGALGALGYAVVCPEASAAFVAVWYTAGIFLTGLLGRQLGPRMLRW